MELVRDSHHCKGWSEEKILTLLCSRFRNDNVLRDDLLTSIGYAVDEGCDLDTGKPVYNEKSAEIEDEVEERRRLPGLADPYILFGD